MRSHHLLSALAAAVLFAGVPALAAPVISYRILDGSTFIGAGSSSNGTIFLSAADNRFTVSGNAMSAPTLTTPNFYDMLSVQSAASAAASTLTVSVTTTGLTGYAGGSVLDAFALNSITGGSFTSATLSTYFDNTNAAYGMGTLLGTSTFTGLGQSSSSISAIVSPSALFSETAIYALNFGAGSASSVSASNQLTSAVPEPATWAMMILGMGAVGVAMRRKNVTTRLQFA